jgi:uncharacterized protein YbaR (Trm112 family)
MALDAEFVAVLRCPETHKPLRQMSVDELDEINKAVETGVLLYADGTPVTVALEDGLVTEDGATFYRVDDDIPVMLAEKGISAEEMF